MGAGGGSWSVSIALKLAHWGYYVPGVELPERRGALGPGDRPVGARRSIRSMSSIPGPADLMPSRWVGRSASFPSPNRASISSPGQGSKFVLLQDSEYWSSTSPGGSGWPKLIKVARVRG